MTNKINFDLNAALKDFQAGQSLTGKNGVLTPLIKQLVEAALAAELEQHLAKDEKSNRKNGHTPKTIKTGTGSFELDTPRDRNSSFEPQIIKKHQTHLTEEIEMKILSMFGLGMSYQDISKHIEEIYTISISKCTISAVTDKIIPKLKEWQQRPLESHYPIVWMDAIHYKVKENNIYKSKAVYTLLGINVNGLKEILGIYVSETEGAKFWLSVLADIQQRGVQDILIACVDGLTGFPEAINAIYPKTEVQLCIIHQIRHSLKYVAYKEKEVFVRDLKLIYTASSLENAEYALDELEKKWESKYPIVIKSWRKKWALLSHYFKYHQDIRKIIYTTNAIESVHKQFRKLTKTKGAFPNENSLLKLLYMGIINAQKSWTTQPPNWNITLSQFAIHFDGRLDAAITL